MFTHILFDFFGTLVEYSPSLTKHGYDRSYRLLTKAGATFDYEGFLNLWSLVFAEFDGEAERDHRGFSMYDVARPFLQRPLGRTPSQGLVKGFVDTHLDEWNEGVRYHPGIQSFLERLSACYRLGIITNTHHAPLIQGHLREMEVEQFFAVARPLGLVALENIRDE